MSNPMKLDKWKLFEMLGYKVYHSSLRRFHDSEARIKVCCAPRRTSKSFSAAHDIILDILTPEIDADGKYVEKRYWVVGPSYSLAEKEFRYIHEALVLKRDKLGLPKPSVCMTNARSGQLFIKWPWGSILEGKTADRPESLLGEAVDAVIYSEAAQLPRGIRERYVAPTLITRKGKEVIATTPEAGAEWVYDLYKLGESSASPYVESFTWDYTANPKYPIEEIEKAMKMYGVDSPVFREQYLGEWVFYSGLVYSAFDPELHIIEPFEIPASWPRYRGIDFGMRDPFVCLWCAVGPSQELYFYREYYYRDGAPMAHHVAAIKAMSLGEHITMTTADSESAQSIEDLSYSGIPCVAASKDRAAGRARVLEYMQPTVEGVLTYPKKDCIRERERLPKMYFFNTMKELFREIKFYRWKEGRPVEGDKERTEGDDHAMDTMRYICMERPSPFVIRNKVVPGSFDFYRHGVTAARLSKGAFI